MVQKYTFSGHESFPCKTLWLKKGYDFVVQGRDFNKPEAVVYLGVGKNMVAAIRFWLRVFGICENDQPTWLGNHLFNDENGKDKYLESLATLWLLHFNLVYRNEATLYNWFFTDFQRGRKPFSRDNLITYVKRRMIGDGKEKQFNANTVKRDVGVLMQNYCMPRKMQSHEDYSSLLLDLHLLLYNEEAKEYIINSEGKAAVIPEIFLYGLLAIKGEDNSIPFDTLQELGLIFCMTDLETIDMLRLLTERYSDVLHYSDVAGIRQVQIIKQVEPHDILSHYYEAV
ncbi:MAG: DUF4007 family protein [Bacteroidaceae bacterium]|jgi:hypothetical protein|nr:DUF4007 family protein [Bacteroidaceae bacterium]